MLLLTCAKDSNEDTVDHQLSDGGPHIHLLVHIDGCHLPGGPHPPNEVGEPVPAPLLRLSVLLQQREVISTDLTPGAAGGCL